jgi:hypothetical protein
MVRVLAPTDYSIVDSASIDPQHLKSATKVQLVDGTNSFYVSMIFPTKSSPTGTKRENNEDKLSQIVGDNACLSDLTDACVVLKHFTIPPHVVPSGVYFTS